MTPLGIRLCLPPRVVRHNPLTHALTGQRKQNISQRTRCNEGKLDGVQKASALFSVDMEEPHKKLDPWPYRELAGILLHMHAPNWMQLTGIASSSRGARTRTSALSSQTLCFPRPAEKTSAVMLRICLLLVPPFFQGTVFLSVTLNS